MGKDINEKPIEDAGGEKKKRRRAANQTPLEKAKSVAVALETNRIAKLAKIEPLEKRLIALRAELQAIEEKKARAERRVEFERSLERELTKPDVAPTA